jgi:heat shock protein HtpX
MEQLRSAALLAAMAGLAAIAGSVMAGPLGAAVALGATLLVMVVALRASEGLILRVYGALPLDPHVAPGLHARVRWLARRAGIATPRLYLVPSAEANAFSAGPAHRGIVGVTQGLLRLLPDDELEGVLAHEVAHLAAGDTTLLHATSATAQVVSDGLKLSLWVSALVVLLLGGPLESILLMAALAIGLPVALLLLQAALSRTRELAADDLAGALTGRPWALASALARLARARRARRFWLGGGAGEPPLLRSHPATAERIERLVGGLEGRVIPAR